MIKCSDDVNLDENITIILREYFLHQDPKMISVTDGSILIVITNVLRSRIRKDPHHLGGAGVVSLSGSLLCSKVKEVKITSSETVENLFQITLIIVSI
jgi:hypothetical protein